MLCETSLVLPPAPYLRPCPELARVYNYSNVGTTPTYLDSTGEKSSYKLAPTPVPGVGWFHRACLVLANRVRASSTLPPPHSKPLTLSVVHCSLFCSVDMAFCIFLCALLWLYFLLVPYRTCAVCFPFTPLQLEPGYLCVNLISQLIRFDIVDGG